MHHHHHPYDPAIAERKQKNRVVRFAVIEDHNSRHSNFAPFDREFNPRPPRVFMRFVKN